MQLYSYFRSSTSFRIRIALNIKGLPYTTFPINIRQGEHHTSSYLEINPQGLVPTLMDQGHALTQSLALLDYLEEQYPTPPLLPGLPLERARVRSIAQLIGCDIHPLNNLKVLKFLQGELGMSERQKDHWYQHWILAGFRDLEKILNHTAGHFCFSNQVTIADICLIPQVYNAIRYQVPLSSFPTISRIYSHCLTEPAFTKALPENQEDWID